MEDTTVPLEYFTYHKKDMEALAVEVVRECVRVVNNEIWSDPHDAYIAIAMDVIKARFGVE